MSPTSPRDTSGKPAAAPDLRVHVAGIELKNPIIAASGTFGYGVEFEDIVHLDRLGGLEAALGDALVGYRDPQPAIST